MFFRVIGFFVYREGSFVAEVGGFVGGGGRSYELEGDERFFLFFSWDGNFGMVGYWD